MCNIARISGFLHRNGINIKEKKKVKIFLAMDLFLLQNPKMHNSEIPQLPESLFRLQSQPISQGYEKHDREHWNSKGL